jgi:hypothetical protein
MSTTPQDFPTRVARETVILANIGLQRLRRLW